MKWLAVFLSFLFGKNSPRFKSIRDTVLEIFEEITFRSRSLITLTLSGLGAMLLFCGGLFIILLELTAQYDRIGHLSWTATLLGGMGLAFLSAFTFATIFMMGWPTPSFKSRPSLTTERPATSSPLESALATLIFDFVKDREIRREASARTPPTTAQREPAEKNQTSFTHH